MLEEKDFSTGYLDTPLGKAIICATESGICILRFDKINHLLSNMRFLKARPSGNAAYINDHINQAKHQLREYFYGKRCEFSVPLDIYGTPFQQKVWECLINIPYGQTISYQAEANIIERPEAIRSVAAANGVNRILMMIPCHRVIGKNGQLVGYNGGLWRKQWLLNHEKHLLANYK